METGRPCAMMSLTVWLRYLSEGPKSPCSQTAEIAQILFPDRFIEMIFGLQIAFDFRRGRRAFAVERAAGREMHQPNASALMTSSSGIAKEQAFEKIHSYLV